MAERVCFLLQVAPDQVEDYVAAHSPVSDGMLGELRASGRHNYSLFLGDGGAVIGYYEVEDDARAQAYLLASPVAAAWESRMRAHLVLPPGARADRAARRLTQVFNLEDQLARRG